MTSIPYTQVRKNFKNTMQQVCDDNTPIIITRQGGDSVIMLSEDEYNSIIETVHLTRSPENLRQLLKSKALADKGELEFHDLIAE